MGLDDILTINELAAETRRNPQSVRVWIRRHGLPAFRKGVAIFVRREDLDAWKVRPEIAAMLAKGEQLIASRTAPI